LLMSHPIISATGRGLLIKLPCHLAQTSLWPLHVKDRYFKLSRVLDLENNFCFWKTC
jgi:hypothetical protein